MLVCALLALTVAVPIGTMYWDVLIYYDAANRTFEGQVLINDFFMPVDPLGYYLFVGWVTLFPNAQPALLAHWSLLAITSPLIDTGPLGYRPALLRHRIQAFGAVPPFHAVALQHSRILSASLIRRLQHLQPLSLPDAVCARGCPNVRMQPPPARCHDFTHHDHALFFLKITGFVAGNVIAAYAFFDGRMKFRILWRR